MKNISLDELLILIPKMFLVKVDGKEAILDWRIDEFSFGADVSGTGVENSVVLNFYNADGDVRASYTGGSLKDAVIKALKSTPARRFYADTNPEDEIEMATKRKWQEVVGDIK